jgi:hypothetical protein
VRLVREHISTLVREHISKTVSEDLETQGSKRPDDAFWFIKTSTATHSLQLAIRGHARKLSSFASGRNLCARALMSATSCEAKALSPSS